MFKHIVVPTDGSALSRGAAQHAVDLAAEFGAQVTFVHALPKRPLPYFGGEGGVFLDQMPPDDFDEIARAQAERHMSELSALAQAAGVKNDNVVDGGAIPYQLIIQVADAKGGDLIVMASHGHTGIKAMILAGETQKVLTHTKIPVLVYR